MQIKGKTVVMAFALAFLILISINSASPARAAPLPGQGQSLTFKMMILTEDDAGPGNATGGQVAVTTGGSEPTIHPIDSNGLTSFTIPAGPTSRATFSGEFVAYTLRFEFDDGMMSVFNDSLPAGREEVKVPYYLNIDGTYVVEYMQDYLYMLAPADPGAFVMSPILTQDSTLPAAGAASTASPFYEDEEEEDVPEDEEMDDETYLFLVCAGYLLSIANPAFPPLGGCVFTIDQIFTELTLYQKVEICAALVSGNLLSLDRAAKDGEIPTLEISLIRPDGSLSFLEWLPVGGTGEINGGVQWATSLDSFYDDFSVNVTLNLTFDFLEAMPQGRNILAYRFIDSEGAGSNYRLFTLEKR